MKSLVALINTLDEPIELGPFTLAPEIPVIMYRNLDLYDNTDLVGKLRHLIEESYVVGITFNGAINLPQESQERISDTVKQVAEFKNKFSYSFAYYWNRATCADMLDGFQKQLNQFDWSATEVTVPRVTVLQRADGVISLLAAGYLYDATQEIKNVTPDPTGNFLDAANLGMFVALFESALVEEG